MLSFPSFTSMKGLHETTENAQPRSQGLPSFLPLKRGQGIKETLGARLVITYEQLKKNKMVIVSVCFQKKVCLCSVSKLNNHSPQ